MEIENLYNTVNELIEQSAGKQEDLIIRDLHFITEGFSNDIAMFNLQFSFNGEKCLKDIVFKDYSKSYKGNSGLTKYKKELAIFKAYQDNVVINVPEVYFENEKRAVILMEKIKGVTVDKLYTDKEGQPTKILKRFGETLAHIHSLDTTRIETDVISYYKDQELYFNNYISMLKKRILSLNEYEYMEILDSIYDRFKTVDFCDICLNHGDYHFLNALLTESKDFYIIDWEKAIVTDYRYDIANTLTLCYSWFGIDFRKEILEGYINVSGHDIIHLECFEALKSFDSFTACIPLIQGGDDSHIRDRSFQWLKRRYELFVKNNDRRIEKAEEYLKNKGIL